MPIQPGSRLGAYEVQEFVGRGAMGVVYRAYHEGLARPAAVKVLQALAPDLEATARFRREARSIAQMRHPNILNVFDFGEFDGVPYMIVEYVPGGSLGDRLHGGQRVGGEAALSMLRGIAAGLDYAHSLGVVHRDVKPANVLLGPGETPILADFGLAKLLVSASVETAAGVTTGTPAYMAPEQVKGSSVGPAADRYALATVAYELLTGALPFESEGVLELLYAHVYRQPAPASERQPALGGAVDAVLARGLAKEPAERWSSCLEMVDALERALAGQPPPAAPVPRLPPAAAATVPLGTRSLGGRARRSRRPVAAAAAGLLLLLLLAAFAIARSQRQPGLTLSSSSVLAGDSLVVTGSGLPSGQAGTVQLESNRRQIATFKADQAGGLTQDVRIPTDVVEGDHLLLLCWNSGCPASRLIHVTRARPAPSPAASFAPQINLSTVSPRLGGNLKVEGRGFDPGLQYVISIGQGSASHPFAGPAGAPGGAFTASAIVPADLQPGGAEVVACIVSPGQQPKPQDCARQQVTITR